jgi:hypothetical protein
MAKQPTPDIASPGVRERSGPLLFCIGSRTDWQRAGVTGETVTALVVRMASANRSGGTVS